MDLSRKHRRKYAGTSERIRQAAADEISSVQDAGPLYRGNPQHKRLPEDYGLIPPACARLDKTACDEDPRNPERTLRMSKHTAVRIFAEGIRKGLYSTARVGRFPKQIWAVRTAQSVWRIGETGKGRKIRRMTPCR